MVFFSKLLNYVDYSKYYIKNFILVQNCAQMKPGNSAGSYRHNYY